MKAVVSGLFVLLLLTACKKDGYDVLKGRIISFECADSVKAGEALLVKVRYAGGSDGCAQPSHLKWDLSGNLVQVEAFYRYPKKPTACLMYVPTHEWPFQVFPTQTGTLTLRANDEGGVIKTVVVQ